MIFANVITVICNNQNVSLSIKSESIQITKDKVTNTQNHKNSIKGNVSEITFLGQFVRYLVLLNSGQEIQVRSYEAVKEINLNDAVKLSWKIEDFLLHES